MYHHINSDLYSNELNIFDKHLKFISKNFVSVFPTKDKLEKHSVCLVFDDAYADFYFYAYPLLQKYNLKALLAVPTKYIINSTNNAKEKRLNFPHNDMFQNFQEGTFCTFKELNEMQKSGFVQICSHSHSHTNLKEKNVDLDLELKGSKEILEKNLNTKVNTFVFPYGKYNQEILQKTNEIYDYSFRIGGAVHKDFSGINGVNYRIQGDGLRSPCEIFSFKKMLQYRLKALAKRISHA